MFDIFAYPISNILLFTDHSKSVISVKMKILVLTKNFSSHPLMERLKNLIDLSWSLF